MRRIYLDYNATTPIAPEVREAMQPFLAEHYGNPSSSHSLGRACSEAISDAREQLAALIGADADEVFFTGGGTESNNLALKGIFLHPDVASDSHLIISHIEHPAISEPANYLRRCGFEVTVVGCDGSGFINPEDVRDAIRPNTALASIMLANNEIGTVQPIRDISRICHEYGVPVHTDAAQAVGKIRVDVKELDVDMLTIAAHKLYAPKGIGAIFVRDNVDLEPVLHGAPHERGLRAGTENTPSIVALGKAARIATSRIADNAFDAELRDQLWEQLQDLADGELRCHGCLETGLPNTLSVVFPGIRGEALLSAVPEVCASTGAACHSNVTHVSATLAAMGVAEEDALATVRLSTGAFTTEGEVGQAAQMLSEAWKRLAR